MQVTQGGLGRLLPMFSAELAFLFLLKIWSTWFRMNSITNCWTRTSRKAASPLQPTASISFDLHQERGLLVARIIVTWGLWEWGTGFLPARLGTGMFWPPLLHLLLSFDHQALTFSLPFHSFKNLFPFSLSPLLFLSCLLFSLLPFHILQQQIKLTLKLLSFLPLWSSFSTFKVSPERQHRSLQALLPDPCAMLQSSLQGEFKWNPSETCSCSAHASFANVLLRVPVGSSLPPCTLTFSLLLSAKKHSLSWHAKVLLKKLSLGNGSFVKLMTGVLDNSLGHCQEDNHVRRLQVHCLLLSYPPWDLHLQ